MFAFIIFLKNTGKKKKVGWISEEGRKEGLMRNRKQATFRNKPPRKTRKLPFLTASQKEKPNTAF